jgi:hypothetical protein
VGNEALEQGPIGVKDVDEPMADASDVIVLVHILESIGDIEFATDVLDTEGRVTLVGERTIVGQPGIGEGTD